MIDQSEPDFREVERDRDLPPEEESGWDLGDVVEVEEVWGWDATR